MPYNKIALYSEINKERNRQDAKWGEQNHPNGTGQAHHKIAAEQARYFTNASFSKGNGTWLDVLNEEVQEAFAEDDPKKLREELIQVAAVATAWVECIDRNNAS